ncbi:MAG: RagB/SusD family nutrient uptake outer membrane protein [Bacteroidales bacterium]|nr:RagB/SusD family nutrient uptake outer membrane protein [Bacteroidales bacterium]
MKKIRIYILALVAGLLIIPTSCSKDFLETRPTDQLAAGDVFNSLTGAWGAINGVHRSMYIQYNSVQAHGGMDGMLRYIDFMGTDVLFNTTSNGWYLGTYRWTDHRNERSNQVLYWTNLYRMISNANQIINNIDKIAGSESEKKHIKGQALAYRAWSHFMLVQLFADRFVPGAANSQKGVPYMETITFEGQERISVAEVYNKINTDIASAITNLEGYTRANKSHINKSVAQAIQAQIALVQGNWNLAATAANAARQGFSFMTTAQHQDGYSLISNPEFMWASFVQEDQTQYFYSFYAYMSHNFNSTAIRQSPKSILKDLYDKISPTDVRRTFWYPTAVASAQPSVPPSGLRFNYMSSKFKAVSVSDSRGDFPWIRVAEMYLIEAEALARQTGKVEQAKDVLFLLAKNRDPQYVRSANSGQALIEEILIQRRVELWGEGRNFTDLKRLGLPLVRPEAASGGQGGHVASFAIKLTEPAGTNNWTWMIPRGEIDTNPNLEQNPA